MGTYELDDDLGDYTWANVGDIGRITEVLSEGVDL